MPEDLAHLFPNKLIQRSLKTDRLGVAQLRRDAHELTDNAYWQQLRLDGQATDAGQRAYDAAVLRANALGYEYRQAEEFTQPERLGDLLERLEQLGKDGPTKSTADALLGRVATPDVYLMDAFEVVCDEVVAEMLAAKDEEGRKDWIKQRVSTITLFNKLFATPRVEEINRDIGRKFYNYWKDRVLGETADGPKISGNHANRQIGNIRKLLDLYHRHLGVDYENPLAGFAFSNKVKSSRNPFSVEQITSIFLMPGPLANLHHEARLCASMMVETGAREAELLTLEPEDIQTDHEIPHIIIYERDGRSVKTDNSNRIIPVVGIALAAAKKVKKLGGFKNYRLKRKSFSSNVNKYSLRTSISI